MSSRFSGLWPRETPRPTRSEAEIKVHGALETSLPKGWCAYHSLKLRTRGLFSEGDFVVVDPSRPSILVIEVKGGQISQKNGTWFQNNNPMKTPPMDQAFSFRKRLIERFKAENIQCPTIGVAVCFPDTLFTKQPAQCNLNGLIIGGRDLPYLEEILKVVMERSVPEPWPVKGPWLRTLHNFWGETWIPSLSLGDRIKLDNQHRIQLDEEQIEKLYEIEENDRVLIMGGAGTGKTLLACESAKRRAEKGDKVLLLCFTNALGRLLKETVVHPNVTTGAIRHFAAGLLGENPTEYRGDDPSEYWNSVSLRAAIDGLPDEKDSWDTVIIDEGRDLTEDDWCLVRECSKKRDRLWVFADNDQGFWKARQIPEDIQQASFRIGLRKPYRCPPEIQHLADCYAGRCSLNPDLVKPVIDSNIISIKTSSKQRIAIQTGKEINRLLGQGLQPGEIAVISIRGKNSDENICHNSKLGGKKVMPADHVESDSHIVCDTFLRFKGLERPAVIITDLRLVSDMYDTTYSTRMYIAVSRATSLLTIIGVEKEMNRDHVLSSLFFLLVKNPILF